MAAFLRERWRGVAIALVAGVFLSLSGAFGSSSAPFLQRLVYWLGLMLIGSVIGALVGPEVARRGWLETRPWSQGALITGLITLPLWIVAWAYTGVFFGRLGLAALPWFLPPTLAISAVMTALTLLTNRQPLETHAAPAGAAPPRFLERLPSKLKGAEIYAVQAEDHYLRLHTSRGSDLILMRLSDALGELDGIEGAQTHRSWWVAKDAVASASRADGRATLTLRDGTEAPVSRSYAKALREEGWF